MTRSGLHTNGNSHNLSTAVRLHSTKGWIFFPDHPPECGIMKTPLEEKIYDVNVPLQVLSWYFFITAQHSLAKFALLVVLLISKRTKALQFYDLTRVAGSGTDRWISSCMKVNFTNSREHEMFECVVLFCFRNPHTENFLIQRWNQLELWYRSMQFDLGAKRISEKHLATDKWYNNPFCTRGENLQILLRLYFHYKFHDLGQ